MPPAAPKRSRWRHAAAWSNSELAAAPRVSMSPSSHPKGGCPSPANGHRHFLLWSDVFEIRRNPQSVAPSFFSMRRPRGTRYRAQQTCASLPEAPMQRILEGERVRVDIARALFSRRSVNLVAMIWKVLSNSRRLLRPAHGEINELREPCIATPSRESPRR